MKKHSWMFVLFCLFLILLPSKLFIQDARAQGSIYLRADGTVDPPTAPIQRNGELYTLTEDFSTETDGIIVERNGITLDGANHTLTGTKQQSQSGIFLTYVQHVTVKNLEIKSFASGIYLEHSSNNTIEANSILNNHYRGIAFFLA